jgi:hypothetical protein
MHGRGVANIGPESRRMAPRGASGEHARIVRAVEHAPRVAHRSKTLCSDPRYRGSESAQRDGVVCVMSHASGLAGPIGRRVRCTAWVGVRV